MQQRSTEQRSTVDSRRRLTNFKVLVSQSMSTVLRQSVELLSNVKPSAQSQQFVADAVKISYIFGF